MEQVCSRAARLAGVEGLEEAEDPAAELSRAFHGADDESSLPAICLLAGREHGERSHRRNPCHHRAHLYGRVPPRVRARHQRRVHRLPRHARARGAAALPCARTRASSSTATTRRGATMAAASTAGVTSRRRSARGSGTWRVTIRSAARRAATSPTHPPRCRAHRATRTGGCSVAHVPELPTAWHAQEAIIVEAQVEHHPPITEKYAVIPQLFGLASRYRHREAGERDSTAPSAPPGEAEHGAHNVRGVRGACRLPAHLYL
jgi:hypothetical protein